MKKIISVLFLVFICFSASSCGNTEEIKVTELSEKDYQYIDTVYNAMNRWDTTHYDSGEDHYINKISFQDFDGTNKIVFYKNYPVGGYCGSGYYVKEDSLEFIDPDIYDHETTIRNRGCLAQTVINGTDWDHFATDEEKYEIIKDAYISFIESNINAED